jgi:hypothetical protein
MMWYRALVIAIMFGMPAAIVACDGSSPGTGDSDTDTDADTDADSDSDADCDWSTVFAELFANDHVVQVAIDFDDPDAWDEMLAQKMDQIFRPASVTIDGESISSVGIRFKGNSSLSMSQDYNTKSLKLDFEEYVDGQAFRCADKLSLNNATKDPSMMRESLAYALASDVGIVAPRTAFAEVTVDGSLHGVFTMVQQVDHRFLKENYGTADGADDGNLYKLYSDYDFGYLGEDAASEDYGDPVAETGLVLKTNEDDAAMNDYSDVTALTKAIADVLASPTEDSRAALEGVMDVDGYLRYQAWTLAIANLDAYYSMKHNLYVYHHPVTGLFETIPWDANEAFGSFPCNTGGPPGPGDTGEDVYTVDLFVPCGAVAPLNRLSYQVPEYRARYCAFLHELVDVADTASGGEYSVGDQDGRIAAIHSLIGEARQRMDDEGALTQPPGDYTYEDYVTNQGHSTPAGSTGPVPAEGPNLGYFNEERLQNLAIAIVDACD